MPLCSIIIVTYNSGADIEACLHALASRDCEIIVVDNASQDDTIACVKAVAVELPLKLIALSRNVGFAAGINHGARSASGDVLLMLNPDAIAEPDAVSNLMKCLERTRAGAAGGALLALDGEPARGFSFRRLPTLASLLFEAVLLNRVWPSNPVNRQYRCLDADYSRVQEVEQPAGACLAVTREIWDFVGGMDERFFPVWFEDVDLCARIRAAGQHIYYCPGARFLHGGAHSVGEITFANRQLYWYGNMLRYAAKHFSVWEVVVLRGGIVAGMLMRVIASLLGDRPRVVPLGGAIGSYSRVMMLALGMARPVSY